MDRSRTTHDMQRQPPSPRIGLLALTLELYEQLAPGLRQQREQWMRDAVLPALAAGANVRFCRAVYRREDVDATVAEYESAGVDALLVVFLTYAPSQLLLPSLERTRCRSSFGTRKNCTRSTASSTRAK